jgi:hypothetical protein
MRRVLPLAAKQPGLRYVGAISQLLPSLLTRGQPINAPYLGLVQRLEAGLNLTPMRLVPATGFTPVEPSLRPLPSSSPTRSRTVS